MGPLADIRRWVSPYSYCQNNPIGKVDLSGALDHDYTIDKDGNIALVRRTDVNFDMIYAKESWNNGKKDV